MGKNVFRPMEVVHMQKKAFILPPEFHRPKPVAVVEELETAEEYTGPSADDLRREAELFKQNWEAEKDALIGSSRAEAERIVKEAEQKAFEEIKAKNDQAAVIKRQAEEEAAKLLDTATRKVEELEAAAAKKAVLIEDEARSRGMEEGRKQGYDAGRAEAERLVERVHVVLNKAIDKRNDIIEESEAQLIHLVLQIAKKVVKVISENQKNIVINNILQALKKLKSRTDISIRVNLSDLQLTTDHVQDILKLFEKVKNVTVLEDSSVDVGGCVIETDFGQIDARISSQLREIEDRILELVPINTKNLTDSPLG